MKYCSSCHPTVNSECKKIIIVLKLLFDPKSKHYLIWSSSLSDHFHQSPITIRNVERFNSFLHVQMYIDMHWILRILRRIARRFWFHWREPTRWSHRNGQLDPSAPRRKILIANNIRQSEWRNRAWRRKRDEYGERWNFSESLSSMKCRWSVKFYPYFCLSSSLLAVYFHHFLPPFAIPFTHGNGYVFLEPNASFTYSTLGRANETTRYYYAVADPCKQWRREKYFYTVNRMKNIWPGFSSVCYPFHKLIERRRNSNNELDMHVTCWRNNASSQIERTFLSEDSWKLWYTLLVRVSK